MTALENVYGARTHDVSEVSVEDAADSASSEPEYAMTFAEIGHAIGASATVSKQIVNRALRKLRRNNEVHALASFIVSDAPYRTAPRSSSADIEVALTRASEMELEAEK